MSESLTVCSTPIVAPAEIEPLLVDVEDDRLRARELDELQRRQPDRPGADDQARFVGPGAPRLTAWQPMARVSTRAS